MKYCIRTIKNSVTILVVLILYGIITSCGNNGSNVNSPAEMKITFHDKQLDDNSINRIDMTVLQTQIIDINDKNIVISTEKKSFNLLEITENNPVALAHTMVPAGTYKQIRLILDANTTITLSDGTTYPLRVPSGEQTGIKIDGIFSIPAGKLYTLDIDLDPAKSVHYTQGNGYMLKPVISITGSEVNAGNFFYQGTYNNDPFVLSINTNSTTTAISARYPKYIIKGNYYYDGMNQKITITPTGIDCPSCSFFEDLAIDMFGDVPPVTTFNVATFGADYIDLREIGSGKEYNLVRVPTFSLNNTIPTKDFTLQAKVSNSLWVGKTIVAQAFPEEGEGRSFCALTTINPNLQANVDFSIPKSEFNGSSKNYLLVMAIVNNRSDVILSSSGTIKNLQNVLANNMGKMVKLVISRDSIVSSPVNVQFKQN